MLFFIKKYKSNRFSTLIILVTFNLIFLQTIVWRNSNKNWSLNNEENTNLNSNETYLSSEISNPESNNKNDTSGFCSYHYEKKPSYKTELIKIGKSLEELEKKFRNSVQLGGRWSPSDCKSKFKVAFIIPYRNRLTNLECFLEFMHPFLMKQKINYGIYLIEPVAEVQFNRGLLMNIGFLESLKDNNEWNCFLFHDVDMLPEDERVYYQCNTNYPTHFSVAVSKFMYRTNEYFARYFGGVTAFTKEQYEKINGFSNIYFDWGSEDDDLYLRTIYKFNKVIKLPTNIGRYYSFEHKQETMNPDRYDLLEKSSQLLTNKGLTEGLNTIKYSLISIEKEKLFTKILVYYDKSLIQNSSLINLYANLTNSSSSGSSLPDLPLPINADTLTN